MPYSIEITENYWKKKEINKYIFRKTFITKSQDMINPRYDWFKKINKYVCRKYKNAYKIESIKEIYKIEKTYNLNTDKRNL